MLPLSVSAEELALGHPAQVLAIGGFSVKFSGLQQLITGDPAVAVGNFFGARYKKRAELAGGIILIAMGTKILIEHLGLLG